MKLISFEHERVPSFADAGTFMRRAVEKLKITMYNYLQRRTKKKKPWAIQRSSHCCNTCKEIRRHPCNVFFTNTKRAFPGLKCNLLLSIWMNCPTDMSLGTRREKLERKVLKYCVGVRKKNVLVQFLLGEKKEGGHEERTAKYFLEEKKPAIFVSSSQVPHPPPNPSSTPTPTAGQSPYSPSINVQKSLLKQHVGARDVGVVPSAIASFDVVAVFIVTAGHVAAAVPTSEVQ
ncbi:hypothetical protein TIFTF001_020579 [Ficus carica]|uniref:Uncharacterized protein n=1 Tax=Ficus carica TaxID=3494 RepID=A0AA88AFZ9_FICCA|nr:hypothetical protein TIFTF001_020579 [Ficus carica]